jgi:hypothetical protein
MDWVVGLAGGIMINGQIMGKRPEWRFDRRIGP